MPVIYLIRHAEPVSYWDDSDATRPLSGRGRKQAQWMARHLAGLQVTDLRSAPHERCRETAAAIGEALGIEPEIDPKLHISRGFHLPDVTGTMIWVAHSNNIPGALHAAGVSGYRCGHASAWRLEFDADGNLTAHDYTEPEV